MVTRRSLGWLLALLVLALPGAGAAQAQVVATSRVTSDWRSSGPVALAASAAPLATSGTDLGAAPGNEPLGRILLLLQPSATQQQALTAELAALQDPSSSQYHHWLSAAAFAEAYANSPGDVAAVVGWLQSQGFQVAALPAGRGWIEFSGTVAQAEQAFLVQIHLVTDANGAPRPALMGNISVPAALRPVVAGLVSLDGVVSVPALTTPQPVSVSVAELAAETSPTSAAALTPQLEAQLLDLGPLAAKGVSGAGEKIAIATRSNVNASDVAAFRTAFGLSALPLEVDLNGADPGLTGAQAEATLAASWAGAIAPEAQVILVPAASTNATDGVDLALAAIVDQQLANTVEVGFSACEAGMSAGHHDFYSALYQQAAVEGITIVAATGDSGAAACSVPGGTAVTTGYGVNAMASTPWDTAVGVAGFAASSAGLAAWSPHNAADPAYAGGGGSSKLYGAQRWQPAPAHLPAGYRQLSARQLPDLSLPTAIDTSTNPGLAFCLSSAGGGSGCTPMRSGGSGAAASLFAGIAALRAQQQGEQGDLTPTLYQLSESGSAAPFHDIAQGNAQLACAAGSPGCGSNGQIGFTAANGYDLATGLGVPDAASLVMDQAAAIGTTPVIVVNSTAAGQTINPSGSVVLSAVVTSSTGAGVPTGTVTFFDQSTSSNIVTTALSAATGDSSTASQTVTGALAQGSHSIIAEYSGDSTFASGNSPAVVVNAEPTATSTTVTPANNSPTGGSPLVVTAVVSSANAGAGALAPSGTVNFEVDGVSAGSSRLIAGVASGSTTDSSTSITITTPYKAGAHQIVGVYNGDTNYTGSTSTAATITVGTSTPVVTLTPSTTTPGAGGSVILSVTIVPPGSGAGASAPAGTVTFTLDSNTVSTVPVTPGSPSTASYALSGLTFGTHTVKALYSGDTNYNAADSTAVTLNVGKMPTTLAVTPATNSPAANSSLQVTATLTPTGTSSNTPGGTVTFTLDGTTMGTANLTGGTTATTTIIVPATGTHTLAAVYSGDSNFDASTSPGVAITILKTSTTIVANASTTTPALGSSITVNTAITPSTYGTSDPTGTVVYALDGVTEATVPVIPGAPSTSTAPLTIGTAGAHTVVATYSGDSNYASSTSAPITLTVAKLPTTLTITPSTTLPAAGTSMQATAVLSTTATSTTVPTGAIIFTIDGETVATVPVTGTMPSVVNANFTVPSAGTHTLRATYAGDTNYSNSTSSGVTLTVSKSTPTVVLTPASTAPAAGSSLLLTAQVNPPASGATAPTGTVIFSVDGKEVGTGSVSGTSPSTATFTVTTPGVGSHTITASYGGDNNYNAAAAPPVTIQVSKANTTLTVTPAQPTPLANSSMLVTATLATTSTGTTLPTGTVIFTMDGAQVGSSQVTGGTTATTTITVPASGTHTLQAIYSGDDNYNGTTSPVATFTVAKTVTITTVTPSTTAPAIGQKVTVTATVTPSTTGATLPSGTVTFTLDATTVAVLPLTSGSPATASYTLPALTPGTHEVTATYSGDAYYATSTSGDVPLAVPKDVTTMTIAPQTTAPSGGNPLQVSASITAATPTTVQPTGTVTFTLDGAPAATAQVTPGNPASATGTIPSVPGGTHVLAATYSGDTYFTTATATPVTLTASKSPTTMIITPSTLTPTAGSSLDVLVDVISTSSGTGPTGTVTITLDGSPIATGTLTPGAPSTTTVTIPMVSAGTHLLGATYAGDASYGSSVASAVTVVAGKGTTVTTVTATPSSLTAGTPESLTATIAPTTSVKGVTYTFTGAVSFYDGTKLLGQAAVTGDTATLAGLTLLANVSHSITAVYSGDANWIGSTSAALPLAATTLPDTVVLTANTSNPTPGQAVILTVTVTPTSTPLATAEQNPTGIVIFYDGTKVIGQASLVAQVDTDSSIATLTTSTLPGGGVTLSAYYKGDLAYDAALSNSITLSVQNFTITPASTNPATNLNIVQGGAGTESFNVTAVGGFTGTVQLECQAPPQDDMTCAATPQQVTPPGTVTFTIQTYTTPQPATTTSRNTPWWPRAAGGTALAGLLFFLLPFGRRARIFLGKAQSRLLILLLILAGLVGTNVGCSSTSGIAGFGTPLGVATVKVIGNAYVDNTVVSQSLYFTVDVLKQ